MRLARITTGALLLTASITGTACTAAAQSQKIASSYQGAPVRSARTGVSIVPTAWVHTDADGSGQVVTVALLYVQQASPADQVKIDTATLPLDSQGAFSGSYGDFTKLQGVWSGQDVQLTATVSNGKGYPADTLSLDLDPAPPGAPPAVGTYGLTQILDVTVGPQDFEYEDLWNVELVVEAKGSGRVATVTYHGLPGTFSAGPLTVQPDGTFYGVAGIEGESSSGGRMSIKVRGTFLPVDDGVSPEGALNYPVLSQTLEVYGKPSRPFSDAAGTTQVFWLVADSSVKSGYDMVTAHLVTPAAAAARVSQLEAQKGVVAASIDRMTSGESNIPNDTYFLPPGGQRGQYPYPIQTGQLCCTQAGGGVVPLAADAWGVAGADGNGITVAVLDTGVRANHPDLAGKVLAGHDSLPWPWWIDWLRQIIPANWLTSSGDLHGHGTGVAGTITANRNNGQGVAGVAASPRIIPVRTSDHTNHGTLATQTDGILWLLDNDLADVVNMSLFSQAFDRASNTAVRALADRGRVVVAATGNNAAPLLGFPAALPNVVAVGATDQANGPASYSNFAQVMDLVAPGGESALMHGDSLVLCWLAGRCINPVFDADADYCLSYGTSFAAPYVAGIATMILSANPGVRRTNANCMAPNNPRDCVAQVAETIRSTAQTVVTADWNPWLTHANLVDALPAVNGGVAAALPTPTNLAYQACVGAACLGPGLRLAFTAVGAAPMGLNIAGYVVYRDGDYLKQPMSPNPILAGTPFFDTTLPQNGGLPVAGTYEYTVVTLYQNAAGAYARSFSSNVVTVTCAPAGCN